MRASRASGLTAIALAATLVPGQASADPPRTVDQHFTIDPVSDIVLTGSGAGITALLSLILGTGEIRPSPLSTGDENKLLSFDRWAVNQAVDPNADTYSNVGLYAAIGFAVLDPVFSGLRDGWDAALVDAVMYAESLSLTEAITDMTKIAVRRPRPIDYIHCEHSTEGTCSSTDVELSFFSGHAAALASITGTATYLAFTRSPHSFRPWITLAAGTLLTAFVDYERVRAGEHFPTDVIAGTFAGGAIGVLVPHLHRHAQDAPPLWVGAAPTPRGGGMITAGGAF